MKAAITLLAALFLILTTSAAAATPKCVDEYACKDSGSCAAKTSSTSKGFVRTAPAINNDGPDVSDKSAAKPFAVKVVINLAASDNDAGSEAEYSTRVTLTNLVTGESDDDFAYREIPDQKTFTPPMELYSLATVVSGSAGDSFSVRIHMWESDNSDIYNFHGGDEFIMDLTYPLKTTDTATTYPWTSAEKEYGTLEITPSY